VILPCLSVSGPDVSKLLARFTFCPLFGNYNNLPESRELTDDSKQIFFEDYRRGYNEK
jgi:hypothetical protein